MMEFSFAAALQTLRPGAAFEVANSARPSGDYFFSTLLPEVPDTEYSIDSGYMTVRTTAAGMVGMDSPYPPGGLVEQSTFYEQTVKLAIENHLSEAALRKIQRHLQQLQLSGGNTKEALAQEALNFVQKVIVQAIQDRVEWLRGQALVYGAIDWTFNQKRLQVNYGIPAGNLLATRSGTAHYGGTASAFWTDWREANRLLRYNRRAAIMNSATADLILYNPANNMEVLSQSNTSFTIRRLQQQGNGGMAPTGDARDVAQVIIYDGEMEVLNPANPNVTTVRKFLPDGKILFIGNNTRSGYRVGEGSTPSPQLDAALGYTHLGPTVEGGGRPGLWADLFTPENQPWQLRGRGAANVLPVIEAPEKIVVATTNMTGA